MSALNDDLLIHIVNVEDFYLNDKYNTILDKYANQKKLIIISTIKYYRIVVSGISISEDLFH